MFNQTPESCTAFNKAILDQWIKLSQLAIENAERISNININVAKETLEEQVKTLQTLPSIKDAQGWANWRQKATETQLETFSNYTRKIYEASTATQNEVGKVIEQGIQQCQKNLNTWVDTASKSAPAASDAAIQAIKTGIDATNAAIDGIHKATRQAAEIADTGVKAAVNATINTVKQAQQHTTQATNAATSAIQQGAAQVTSAATQQHNKKAAN